MAGFAWIRSLLEEWLEEKANGAELLCGRLEARVLRSEADLAQVMREAKTLRKLRLLD